MVLSIEKNRRGEHDVHLQFEKDFVNYRLDPKARSTPTASTTSTTRR